MIMKSIKFIPETKFKTTEIGEIPEDWNVVKLGEVVQEFKKKNITNNLYPVYSISNIHGFIRSEDFFDKKVYSENLKNYKVVEKNYFAYNPYRVNVGSIGLFCEETQGLVSSAYITFKIKDENTLLPLFLLNIVKSQTYISEIFRISCSRGSVRRSLAFRDLCDIPLPLPPLPEQQKIAAVLSAVQEAKEKTQAVIDATKALKKSMMKHLFTYGPMPPEEAENVPLKETEIGKVPEDWEIKTIEKSVESIEYGYSIAIPKNESQDGIYIVSTADITKEGKIHYNYIRKIIPPKKLTERLILKNGDVLFNWRNSPELIGKTSIFEIEPINNNIYTYASFILRIRCDEKSSHNIYVKYILNYYRKEGVFVKLARRAVNQANYNRNEINKLKIPLPPLPVQQKIASILSAIDAKIEAEENKKQALEELFKTVLHNLMTAKIRVNNLEIKV